MLVAENIEEHKSKLKFFMQRFCGIIKTMDSTHKELSIAIRGYGFFAAVCMFTDCSFRGIKTKFMSQVMNKDELLQ